MVANQAEENQKMAFGPTVFQVCRATKIFRPAVRTVRVRRIPRAKPAQDVQGKMSEEQAAAAEPIPEGKEPIIT